MDSIAIPPPPPPVSPFHSSRQKEESARILCHLIARSHRFIKPYVDGILRVLVPKIKDNNSTVVAQALNTMAELAKVGGEDMIPYIDSLMPLIIDALQDQSSPAKRESALKALGSTACNTGLVVEPYVKFPNLLNILLHTLKAEGNPAIRSEAVKVLGILGALDPHRHKTSLAATRGNVNDGDGGVSGAATAAAGSDGDVIDEDTATLDMSPSNEDYYPTVAIKSLMKFLKDPSLSIHHTAVIQAVMYIFKTLGMKCVPFLPQVKTTPR